MALTDLLRWMAMACLVLVCTMAVPDSQAGVVLNGTRFVYPSQEKEISIKLTNQGKGPVLVKTWLDNGDVTALPETIKLPFTLTPPIFRMEADKETALRLTYTGDASLPKDRESLFWLNVMEVPPRNSDKKVEGESTLQLAFRYRLKLLFHPEGLSGTAKDAATNLAWSMIGNGDHSESVLRVTNNRPYYVSLVEVKLMQDGHATTVEPETIAPFSSHDFVLKKTAKKVENDHGAWSVDYRWIDEWGGLIRNNKSLTR
jgi:chaperone protein EcpD